MTIVASGAISLAAIQAEFGGPATNMVLQSYYAGGSYVAAGTLNGVGVAIPSSGAIKLQDFYGASSVTFRSTEPTLAFTLKVRPVVILPAASTSITTAPLPTMALVPLLETNTVAQLVGFLQRVQVLVAAIV